MVLSLIRTILGPNGRRLPEYGGASGAWMYGLLRDYYCHSQTNATEKHVRKCLAGQCKLSHVISGHYHNDNGYERILTDTRGVAATCTSLNRLRRIQTEVRDILPESVRTAIDPYYHTDATREQVATYLAQALWCTYQS